MFVPSRKRVLDRSQGGAFCIAESAGIRVLFGKFETLGVLFGDDCIN